MRWDQNQIPWFRLTRIDTPTEEIIFDHGPETAEETTQAEASNAIGELHDHLGRVVLSAKTAAGNAIPSGNSRLVCTFELQAPLASGVYRITVRAGAYEIGNGTRVPCTVQFFLNRGFSPHGLSNMFGAPVEFAQGAIPINGEVQTNPWRVFDVSVTGVIS
jgi:hypothetical protein